jgi:hypothetical protein
MNIYVYAKYIEEWKLAGVTVRVLVASNIQNMALHGEQAFFVRNFAKRVQHVRHGQVFRLTEFGCNPKAYAAETMYLSRVYWRLRLSATVEKLEWGVKRIDRHLEFKMLVDH